MESEYATRVAVGEAQAVFTEWDRRYREEPETFMNEVEHLLRETPESYGDVCGPYFFELLKQLREAREQEEVKGAGSVRTDSL